jgi:hypothetical protein
MNTLGPSRSISLGCMIVVACIVPGSEKGQRHVLLFAHNPAVWSGRNRKEVPRTEHDLGSVGHLHRDSATEHKSQVFDLAQRGPTGPTCCDQRQPGS